MKNIKYLLISFLFLFIIGCGTSNDEPISQPSTPIIDTSIPIFTTPSEVSIFENSTIILDVHASDNSPITYTLDNANNTLFILNNSGTLSFKSPVDYEQKTSYSITLYADDGTNTSSQTIVITILDVDENAPIFTTANTNITIDENKLSVIEVTASDESNLTFSLEGGDSDMFTIDSTTGVIKFQNLLNADYETKNHFIFNVIASDGLNSSKEEIRVTLNNINDNTPYMSGSRNETININENEIFIASYVVNDNDGDTLFVTLSNNLFDFNLTTGKLSFISPPDYETEAHTYTLTLNITDGLYTTRKNLTISVSNIDDVVPVLTDFITTIPENIPVGTLVGVVNIIESGDSPIEELTLTGLNSDNFNIDITGKITTKVEIDFETLTSPTYTLNVKAKNQAGYSDSMPVTINISDINELTVPILVVIMNWNDYSETDALLWHNKIFNTSESSVANWYKETTGGAITFTPVSETSGTTDDGIIILNMGINHPGGYNDTTFRDTYIKNAITSAAVANSVDFAALDVNNNGELDLLEIEIIFIVAGGEESNGGPVDHSIWAHAWSFPSSPGVSVDGVKVMTYNGNSATSGSYSRFGSMHDNHSATIGVIVHELGHAMLDLRDFYDDGGGSGLGWYDVMSGGAWASQDSDTYPGETPTQFSTYNKILSGMTVNTTLVNSTTTTTLRCSENDVIKLTTSNANEYFLIECRDTDKVNSDISMNNARNGGVTTNNNASFTNLLFGVVYHVDDNKNNNREDGSQTSSNHYNISVVEKDTTYIMTNRERIEADYNDVLTDGDILDRSRTKLYNGSATGYAVEVLNSDYTNRTMTIKVTK